MNATESAPANIVQLPVKKQVRKKRVIAKAGEWFNVYEFENGSGSTSFRVDGYKRDGARVRENYATIVEASCRQIELETEYLKGHAETTAQATKLTPDQVRLCEGAILQLGEDWPRIIDVVVFWKQQGKQRAVVESERIDEAVKKYLEWLEKSTFRDATKRHWKTRMKVFRDSVSNVRVSDVTPEFIENYLAGRKTSAGGKDTDKRAISRFFSWCIERPRRWAVANPCKEVKIEKGEAAPIAVLPVKDCQKLLRAAAPAKLAPYVAVCLFGGLRPFEAARLEWKAVNLKDREIRLEANQTKTGRARVVAICDTLHAWLKAHKNEKFYPANWRKKFDAVRKKAKIKAWPSDVMRHTAISHYFRNTGSYGKTAEQFGNSEAIIKAHYQGRVTSADTKKFYSILPKKGGK
jgi:integrase